MPHWVYWCDHCGISELDAHFPSVVARNIAESEDDSRLRCPFCKHQMTRQASAPNFAVHGFNAKNGYSK